MSASRLSGLEESFVELWVVNCTPRYFIEIDVTLFKLNPGDYTEFYVPLEI